MATVILGNQLSGAPTLRGFFANREIHVAPTTTGADLTVPASGFIDALGLWWRATATGWSLMLGIYDIGGNGLPITLLARTAAIPFTATGVAAGVNVEATLDWVNTSAAPGSIPKVGSTPGRLKVPANMQVGLIWYVFPTGSTTPGGAVQTGTIGSAANGTWQGANTTKMLRNNFSWAITDALFLPGIYAVLNVPDPPIAALSTPANAASISEASPVLSGTFTPGEAGDTLSAYQVEVWLDAGTSPLRDSGVRTATSTQQANGTWQYTYDGPTLVANGAYKWRARVQATGGGWSAYTAFRTFTTPPPDPTGYIDLLTSAVPANGAKIDRPDQMTWAARWVHNLNDPMDRAQIQLRNPDGTTYLTSAEINKAVAAPIPTSPPGKLFTISYAEALAAGLNGSALPAGRTFHAYIRGRAQAANEWSAYAGPLIFRTNALAGTPEMVSPADSTAFSTRPQLIVRGYDPDPEDVPGTDTIWQFEILRVSTNTSVTVDAGSYVPGTTPSLNEARFQLTSTEVPAFDTYRWRARSVEAAAGPAGTSPWSAWRTFAFNSGPTAVITSPTPNESVPTSAIRITWTNSEAQKFYQVQVFEQGSDARRYVTTVIASTNLYHDIPLDALPPNIPYYVRVTVFNEASIQGTSADVRFTIVPGSIVALRNVTVVVQQLSGDVEPTTPEIAWERSAHPEARFRSYLVRRYETSKGRATAVLVAEIRDIGQTTLRDYHAPPGVDLTYLVSQRGTNDAGDVTESAAVSLAARVDLLTPVIVALSNPSLNRFLMRSQQAGPPSEKSKPRRSVVQTWGAEGLPTVFKAPGVQKVLNGKFTIATDDYGDVEAKKQAIERVLASGSLVSFRKGTQRYWVDIADNDITPGDTVGTWDVTLQLEQTAYREILG